MAHNESTTATVEKPKTPRPKLSLINPSDIDPNSIPPENRYIVDINQIRRERQNDKPNYEDDEEDTKKSKQEYRKDILHKMANPENENIYERNLAKAILSRIDLEEQKAVLEKKIVDFESKDDFYEYYKYDFKYLKDKINRAKNLEKLYYEEDRRNNKRKYNEDMLNAMRKGGKTKKRRSKHNRKSIRQRK